MDTFLNVCVIIGFLVQSSVTAECLELTVHSSECDAEHSEAGDMLFQASRARSRIVADPDTPMKTGNSNAAGLSTRGVDTLSGGWTHSEKLGKNEEETRSIYRSMDKYFPVEETEQNKETEHNKEKRQSSLEIHEETELNKEKSQKDHHDDTSKAIMNTIAFDAEHAEQNKEKSQKDDHDDTSKAMINTIAAEHGDTSQARKNTIAAEHGDTQKDDHGDTSQAISDTTAPKHKKEKSQKDDHGDTSKAIDNKTAGRQSKTADKDKDGPPTEASLAKSKVTEAGRLESKGSEKEKIEKAGDVVAKNTEKEATYIGKSESSQTEKRKDPTEDNNDDSVSNKEKTDKDVDSDATADRPKSSSKGSKEEDSSEKATKSSRDADSASEAGITEGDTTGTTTATTTEAEVTATVRGEWNPEPPLKHSAWLGDQDYIHDEQPQRREELLPDQDLENFKDSSVVVSRYEVTKSFHVAVATLLIGFVSMVMALFYLVKQTDPSLRLATWRLLSVTFSFFIAVLMFSGTQEILAFLTGEGQYGTSPDQLFEVGHRNHKYTLIQLAFLRFITFWLLLQCCLYSCWHHSPSLRAWSKLGSHIVAFAGMDAFASVQDTGIFSGSVLGSFVACILSAMIIWLIFDMADWCRRKIVQRNFEEHARHHWIEHCREAEHETAALMLGLCISQTIRFAILGHYPSMRSTAQKGKTGFQVISLFAVGIFLGLMVVPLEMAFSHVHRHIETLGRFIRIVRETLAMTMAWCLVYWARWAFWAYTSDNGLGFGDKMTALLIMALFLSALSIVGVFLIEKAAGSLAHSGLHTLAGLVALSDALGFVMGLAWETVFKEALAGISVLQILPLGYTLNNLLLIFLLCLLMLPAWMWYILPEDLPRGESMGSKLDLLAAHERG